jgi:hypothetical protein
MISRKVYLKISPNGPGSVVDFKLGRGTSILVFPFAIAAMIVAAILFIYLSSFIFQLGAIGGIVTEFIAFPVFSVLLTLLVLGCFNVKVFASDHIRSGNYSLKIIRDYVCECPVTQKQ